MDAVQQAQSTEATSQESKDPLPQLLFWWRKDPVMQVVLMFWLGLKSVTLHNAHFNTVGLKYKWGQKSSGFKLERVILGPWINCGPYFYRSVCCCQPHV